MARLLQMSGVVVDLMYRVDAVPVAGGEADVTAFDISAGGGFNAMVAAKRAGMSVFYGGVLGTGLFSDIAERDLRKAGIVVLAPRIESADQGSCVVLIDDDGERTFVSREGVEGIVGRDHLSSVDVTGFDWVLLSGYALAYEESRRSLHDWLRKLPKQTRLVFDPSPIVGRIPTEILDTVLKTATWVSANASEAAEITGCGDPMTAARELARNRRHGGGAVVRGGADGCHVADGGGLACHVSGYSVNAIDTNGAGDAHLGSFIAALSRGCAPVEAAGFANAAAALSTTREGPATAPALEDVEALLATGGVAGCLSNGAENAGIFELAVKTEGKR